MTMHIIQSEERKAKSATHFLISLPTASPTHRTKPYQRRYQAPPIPTYDNALCYTSPARPSQRRPAIATPPGVRATGTPHWLALLAPSPRYRSRSVREQVQLFSLFLSRTWELRLNADLFVYRHEYECR